MTNQTYVMVREDVPSVWLGEGKKEKEKKQIKKQSRLSKGVVIASTRIIVKVNNENAWLVESEKTDGKFYKVTEDGECECYDNSVSHNVCEHVHAICRTGIA